MTFKILHLADVHLDRPFVKPDRTPKVSHRRRDGLRQCVQRALELARSEEVDAVTIGGDLYEAEFVSPDTAQFLLQQFSQAAPTRIFIAPGNQDPFTRNSLYAYLDWPSNVHIFREPRLTAVNLTEGLELWGAAHDSSAFFEPLLTDFHLREEQPAILLIHGTERSLALPGRKRPVLPFSFADIRHSGFQLALSGHIHQRQLVPADQPLLCYPGSPEPLSFAEESGHSVLLAEWDSDQWKIDSVDISRWQCRTWELDVSEFHSQEQVVEKVRSLSASEPNDKLLLARIVLRGLPDPKLELEEASMLASLADAFADLRFEDQTSPYFDLNTLKAELTMTGTYVRRMLTKMEAAHEAEDHQAEKVSRTALTYGLLALEGRKVSL